MSVLLLDISHERIGEPETGVWCPTCSLPSGVKVQMALIIVPHGADLTTVEPYVQTAVMFACPDCNTTQMLPEKPQMIDNRD